MHVRTIIQREWMGYNELLLTRISLIFQFNVCSHFEVKHKKMRERGKMCKKNDRQAATVGTAE